MPPGPRGFSFLNAPPRVGTSRVRLNVSRAKKARKLVPNAKIIVHVVRYATSYDIEEYVLTDVRYDDATIIKPGLI